MWCFSLIIFLNLHPEIDRAIKEERAENFKTEILAICNRESKCNISKSTHESDSKYGKYMFESALKKRWISASCDYSKINFKEWAPRGLYGLAPPYHLRRIESLTGPCAKPETLDDPYLSTVAAIRFIKAHKKKSCYGRLRLWAGIGTWRKKSKVHKIRQTFRTCGIKGLLDYAFS